MARRVVCVGQVVVFTEKSSSSQFHSEKRKMTHIRNELLSCFFSPSPESAHVGGIYWIVSSLQLELCKDYVGEGVDVVAATAGSAAENSQRNGQKKHELTRRLRRRDADAKTPRTYLKCSHFRSHFTTLEICIIVANEASSRTKGRSLRTQNPRRPNNSPQERCQLSVVVVVRDSNLGKSRATIFCQSTRRFDWETLLKSS